MAQTYKKSKNIIIRSAQMACLAVFSAATPAAETASLPINDTWQRTRDLGLGSNSPEAQGQALSPQPFSWPTTLYRVGMQVNLPSEPGVPRKTSFLLQHQQSEPTSYGMPAAREPLALQTWLKGKRTLYEAEQDNARVDVNLRGSRVLAAMAPERKIRGWSASLSQTLNPNWRVSAELAGSYRYKAEAPETATHLFVAASYAVNSRMTFDTGIARRLSGTTPDTTVFFAFSLPLELLHH